MANTTFQGPVKSEKWFSKLELEKLYQSERSQLESLGTVDLTAGRMLYNNVAGAATLTLPAD